RYGRAIAGLTTKTPRHQDEKTLGVLVSWWFARPIRMPLAHRLPDPEYIRAMMPPVAETSAQPSAVLDTLGPLLLDGAWGRQARDYLGRGRQLLFEQHQAGASGGAIVAHWTAVVDHVVQALYAAARASYAERYTVLDTRVALIAQGGYGRAELNPCSDIDLLVLYPQRPDAFVETVTEKVLYALWD